MFLNKISFFLLLTLSYKRTVKFRFHFAQFPFHSYKIETKMKKNCKYLSFTFQWTAREIIILPCSAFSLRCLSACRWNRNSNLVKLRNLFILLLNYQIYCVNCVNFDVFFLLHILCSSALIYDLCTNANMKICI